MHLSNLNDFNELKFTVCHNNILYYYDIYTSNVLWYDIGKECFNVKIDGVLYMEFPSYKNIRILVISNQLYSELIDLVDNTLSDNGLNQTVYNKTCNEDIVTRHFEIFSKNGEPIEMDNILLNISLERNYYNDLNTFCKLKEYRKKFRNKVVFKDSEIRVFETLNNVINPNFLDSIIMKIKYLGKENLNKKENLFITKLTEI